MTITRNGKCNTCKKPCKQSKEFEATADLFNPQSENTINNSIAKDIKVWRSLPMYCLDHQNKEKVS